MPTSADTPSALRWPLVSVIVPSIPDHFDLLAVTLGRLAWQDYPAIEIIVEKDAGISVGEQRNNGAARARGSLLCHCDSDTARAPDSIRRQVERMLSTPGAVACGTSRFYCYDLRVDEAAEKSERAGVACESLVYKREAWEAQRFDAESQGECNRFKAAHRNRTIDMADLGLFVALRHGHNVTGDAPLYGVDDTPEGRRIATAAARIMLGCDLEAYRNAAHLAPPEARS
jgi:cellulose synthase/poly-beta-1,6-N-acetylglucosamine synthase-like glycosyltransferase